MSKDNISFSFIIPAYNAQKTIDRAVISIAEAYRDAEIIVVENGSTDNTTQNVQRLQAHYTNVILLHSEKGVSRARNIGISSARGEWVVFVDADDLWLADEETLRSLTERLGNADFILGSYEKDDILVKNDFWKMDTVLTEPDLEQAAAWIIGTPTLRMTVWAKIFRKKFLIENNILFNNTIRVSEDSLFIYDCLINSKHFAISEVPIYRLCSDQPSVTRSIDPSRTQAYLDAIADIKNKFENPTGSVLLRQAFRNYMIAQLNLICVHNIFNCKIDVTWAERKDQAKAVIRHDVLNNAIRQLRFTEIKNLSLMPAWMFKHGLITAGGLICYTRSLQNQKRYQKGIKQAEKGLGKHGFDPSNKNGQIW